MRKTSLPLLFTNTARLYIVGIEYAFCCCLQRIISQSVHPSLPLQHKFYEFKPATCFLQQKKKTVLRTKPCTQVFGIKAQQFASFASPSVTRWIELKDGLALYAFADAVHSSVLILVVLFESLPVDHTLECKDKIHER